MRRTTDNGRSGGRKLGTYLPTCLGKSELAREDHPANRRLQDLGSFPQSQSSFDRSKPAVLASSDKEDSN